MIPRLSLLWAISVVVSAASMASSSPSQSHRVQANSCTMHDSVRTNRALERLNLLLTDTAAYYAGLRVDAGLQATVPADLVIVTDTVACRRAVDAMRAYYDSTSDSSEVRSVNSGLLVRANLNRLILVVALSNPWSGSQWIVLDSSYNVIRHTL